MGFIASVLSLIFTALVFIYIYGGIYVFRINSKAHVNRAFLGMCISASLWSLGFAMANSSITIEQCIFWRRISALGWTSIYSILLNFLLLLANEDNTLKRKRLFWILHVPAIINMYIFSFSNSMAKIQYNLVQIDNGWINVAVNNKWDILFYVYYITYTLASILVVWKWGKKLKDDRLNKQAKLILISLLSGIVLGTFTDIVLNSISSVTIPQMGPLYMLFPIAGMYYSSKHFGLMKQETVYKDEIVATDQDQKKIFIYLALVYCIGGIFNFIVEYIPTASKVSAGIKSAILKSIVLFIIGCSLVFIQRIKNRFFRENFSIAVILFSIPIISFQFLEHANVTVWAFPIIIMISALLFSNRTLLVSATIIAIVTQRLVWILRPEPSIIVGKYDYALRLGVFIFVFLMGSYINRMYVSKIKENDYKIAFQKMNLEISYDFVNINQENLNEKVNILLAKMGIFFQVERAFLFLINNKENTMTYSNEWCNEGIETLIESTEVINSKDFPWWLEQLNKNELVYIENVNNMPIEATLEKKYLIKSKVKSLIAVPINGDGKIQGFIGMESVNFFKIWPNHNIELLSILANLISHGLTKIRSEKEIEFMAYYDQLTKLPNRFLFEDRVNQAIFLAKRTEKFVSVLFLDLDNFKSVNDTLGHNGGDMLLREVAEGLINIVRKTDTVSRFGGDEFMIMLNNIEDQSDIILVTNKIMQLFSKPFIINGQDILVTSSAGVSIYPMDGEDANTLIKNADTAMYKAKDKGRNQYALCTEDMKEEVKLKMMLSNDLYRALERNELIVYYQPQIDIKTGEINGLEALLRWYHPTLKFISPAVFIPLAEKNGLINSIGEWVLRTACVQNKKMQNMDLCHLRMAVNLSGIQFMNQHIAKDVQNILRETDLHPKYLELEITESIAINEVTFVEEVLNKLKSIGITIAIDDFGMEYSSLSRLKMLPIDRLKIDMQFIQGIENSDKDRAITMVIINLAKSLGLNVLAEGVETLQQADFLFKQLCDDVQGYYYYKPMTAEDIEKILLGIKNKGIISNSFYS